MATAASLEEFRAAHRRLLAAHQVWMRELRKASTTLRYEDLVPVAGQMDEAFRRFLEASESVRLQIERVRSREAIERADRLQADFQRARATYAALLNSFAVLNPDASMDVGRTFGALLKASEVFDHRARQLNQLNGEPVGKRP